MPPVSRVTLKDVAARAVVALDDTLAIGAMRAALDAGLAVGPEFGVTGFDDTPGVQHFSPSLTSVRQPVLQVAQTLAPMLFQRIDGQRLDPDKVILAPRLIVRASSLRTTMKEQ